MIILNFYLASKVHTMKPKAMTLRNVLYEPMSIMMDHPNDFSEPSSTASKWCSKDVEIYGPRAGRKQKQLI